MTTNHLWNEKVKFRSNHTGKGNCYMYLVYTVHVLNATFQ